jgi:hypothetical protein
LCESFFPFLRSILTVKTQNRTRTQKKGIRIKINTKWSRDSSVGVPTAYGLGVRVPVGARIFSSPRRPDRSWGPPSLLSNGHRGLFPRRLCGQGGKLITHLQLVPRSRMVELYLHSPMSS